MVFIPRKKRPKPPIKLKINSLAMFTPNGKALIYIIRILIELLIECIESKLTNFSIGECTHSF